VTGSVLYHRDDVHEWLVVLRLVHPLEVLDGEAQGVVGELSRNSFKRGCTPVSRPVKQDADRIDLPSCAPARTARTLAGSPRGLYSAPAMSRTMYTTTRRPVAPYALMKVL